MSPVLDAEVQCTYLLHILFYSFRTVYQGSAATHKATRLQPATEYTFRAAAISESGQGAWSDHVTFKTLPTPPLAPTGTHLNKSVSIVL